MWLIDTGIASTVAYVAFLKAPDIFVTPIQVYLALS